jgi:hypothetical protein
MTNVTGFQAKDDTLAVNYFADRPGLRVPNNSALVLRLLAEMADVTGDVGYRAQCEGLLKFMLEVQLDTGEIPYGVKGLGGGGDRIHFQCYQYNAFQTIYLMRYYELTGDVAVLPAIQRVLDYLTHGMDKNGRPYFDCSHPRRAITYHASALGHTFLKATQMGFGDYLSLSDRAFGYTLRLQKPNGSFPHSKGDYAILQDHRAYPRYLAMILFHLIELAASQVAPAPASVLHPTARG